MGALHGSEDRLREEMRFQRTNKTAEYLGEKKTTKTEEGIAPQGCEYFGEKKHRVLPREDRRRTSTTEKREAPIVSRAEYTLTLATSSDTEHICATPDSRGSAYRAPEIYVGRESRVYIERRCASNAEKRGSPLVSRAEDKLTLATSRDTEHIWVTPESRGSTHRARESDVGRESRVYIERKRTSTTEKGEGAATAASHISRSQLQKKHGVKMER
jgi:hypothetical protein